jgi:hypothetical protein
MKFFEDVAEENGNEMQKQPVFEENVAWHQQN